MISFHRQSGTQMARKASACVLVAAFGLIAGAAPAAFAAGLRATSGLGTSSVLAMLQSSKRTMKLAQLPPVSPDSSSAVLPPGVTLSEAQGWFSRAILVRQSALLSLVNSLTTKIMIQESNRSQLTDLVDLAMARLNSLAAGAADDTSVAMVASQVSQVMNLRVLNLLVPQVHLLANVDVLIGLAAQLSEKESSAAAAIAISRVTLPSLHSEQVLDETLKSLAATIISELGSTQGSLLALSGSPVSAKATTFSNAKISLATAAAQLRLANLDLSKLVAQLVGR
ncbi:MAG TPA: hypothetical protein VMU99_09465 [Acidimicrobiales bacterium]|nr:hypothetical protein [Acidimicrobiales bacterium]